MNRRRAIQRIVIASAGAMVLPSCLQSESKPVLALKKLKISAGQEKLLASLTQAIIPTTDTPGAKEMKSHEFALKMTDDCASPEDQQKFTNGLKQFEETVKKKYGSPFTSLDKARQQEVLVWLEAKKEVPEDVLGFYRTIRGLTLQSYTGSEYYMTNVMKYNIIPKKYRGCVAVADV